MTSIERVSGYCITWDSDRLPNLSECVVDRVGEQRFLYPLGNEDDRVVEYVTLRFGEEFFFERLSALVHYGHLLVEERQRLLDLSREVGEEMDDVLAEIRQLREAADVS